MLHDEKFALVLAGGGAKGSYQIGAWKALREEGIQFNAVIGASVGALNAGLIATGSFHKAEELWNTISFDNIVDIPKQFIKNGNLDLDMKNIQAFAKYVVKNKGLDTLPLYKLIRSHLNEQHIRRADIDIGIVTFNVSSLKPREVYLESIPRGQLARYLLASASFPLFKTVEIEGKRFTDGGVYDNIPFSMAKSRGYKKIIVLDISGMGHNRRPNIIGTDTIYIKNSQNIGWELDFTKEKLEHNKLLGYLDTRKVFGKNTGLDYFILPDKRKTRELEDRLMTDEKKANVTQLLDILEIKGDTYQERIRNALPARYKHTREISLSLLECAAKSLNIPRVKEYSMKQFIQTINDEYVSLKTKTSRPTEKDFGKFIKSLKKRVDSLTEHKDLFELTPAEYSRVGNMIFGRDEKYIRLKTMSAFFPEIIGAKIMEILQIDNKRL